MKTCFKKTFELLLLQRLDSRLASEQTPLIAEPNATSIPPRLL